MGPYQRTPKEVTRAIRCSGLGVRSVGPVGDFLDKCLFFRFFSRENHVLLSGRKFHSKLSNLDVPLEVVVKRLGSVGCCNPNESPIYN